MSEWCSYHPSIFIWATETRDANIWVGGLASVETSQHFIPIIIFWMQLANGPPPPPAAAASRPVIFSDQFANGVPVVEAQLERREAAAELTCSHRQATISPLVYTFAHGKCVFFSFLPLLKRQIPDCPRRACHSGRPPLTTGARELCNFCKLRSILAKPSCNFSYCYFHVSQEWK